MGKRIIRCWDCKELIDYTWERMCLWCKARYEKALREGCNWALERAAALARLRPHARPKKGEQQYFDFGEGNLPR